MTWDYGWQVGPKGGTLSDLDDYVLWARLAAETVAGKRGINQVAPYRHGSHAVAHKFTTELVVPLEVAYRYTNASGVVTHGSGKPGHVFENKQTVERLLYGSKGLATLRRVIPAFGTCEAYVEPMAASVMTQNEHTFLYLLNAPDGSWRGTAEVTDSSTPVTVTGNHPVWDAVVEIVGGTNVVVTMTADGATITITGATPGTGVRVNFGTGRVTQISGGTDYGEFVSFNKPYGMILEPGDNAFTTSGSPSSVTFKFFPRVR